MGTGNWTIATIANHMGGIFGWTALASISGTTLNNIIEQEINFVEQYTSETIDSNAIPQKFQPSIIDLVHSKILLIQETQQGGVDNVRLGELSVSQGAGGGSELATQLRVDALKRLKELQRKVRYRRVIGA